MRMQPIYLPTWATTASYPAGTDPWSGTARRIAPTAPELAAGATPGGQLPAQTFNFLQGVAADHVRSLADVYSLGWTERGGTQDTSLDVLSGFPGTLIASAKEGGVGAHYRPWLLLTSYAEGSARVWRSRDGASWIPSAAVPGVGLSSEARDLYGWGSKAVLIMIAASTRSVWGSADGGATWTGPTVLSGSLDRIAWCEGLSRYVAAGAGALATSPDLITWTPRTSAHASAVAHIAVAGPGETGAGVCILRSASNVISHSTDGVTFADLTVGSEGFAGGCWSEAHQAWFAVSINGGLWRAPAVSGTWAYVATLTPAGASGFARPRGVTMVSHGKNLVILGQNIRVSNTVLERSGTILVYDPVNNYGQAISPFVGDDVARPFDRIIKHDGRLVAARTQDGPRAVVHLAMSLRAPWETA